MSIPTQETVFGTIEFQNKTYYLLSQPLNDKCFEKINKYKKENNCGLSSAPWSVNKYKWVVEDNKLYLIDVRFKLCDDKSNHIQNIFDTDKLFSSWVNYEIKLLVSKEDIDDKSAKREVIVLNVQQGMLKGNKSTIEEYRVSKMNKYLNINIF